jgi:NADH-quinone oxidoreductase subunit L
VVTWVGVLTALFAASIAVAQNDIKRILAYSTVSQLGFMMMGLGVGGVAVGMFHLITHAFFKALLFLGAGSVIHGVHEEQDIRRMGGLRKFMPVTFAVYAVGMLALSGFPLLFSGFWSKDAILHAAHEWQGSRLPFFLGMLAAFLTAFYMMRQVIYVFFGEARGGGSLGADNPAAAGRASRSRGIGGGSGVLPSEAEGGRTPADVARSELFQPVITGTLRPGEHPGGNLPAHESPGVMLLPMGVLAVFAVLLGFVGTPAWPWFQSFFAGQPAAFAPGHLVGRGVLVLVFLSSAVALAGLGLSWWMYRPVAKVPKNGPLPADWLETRWPETHRLLSHKYFVDEIYGASVVRVSRWLAMGAEWLDRTILSGIIGMIAGMGIGLSWLSKAFDEFVVNVGFDAGCDGLSRGGRFFSRWQTGLVQGALKIVGTGLVVLILLLIWGMRP